MLFRSLTRHALGCVVGGECRFTAGAHRGHDALVADSPDVASNEDARMLLRRRTVTVGVGGEHAVRVCRGATDVHEGHVGRAGSCAAVRGHGLRRDVPLRRGVEREVLDGDEFGAGVCADLVGLVLIARRVGHQEADVGVRVGAQEGAERTVGTEEEDLSADDCRGVGFPQWWQGQLGGAGDPVGVEGAERLYGDRKSVV